jgi:hypothetical protein
MRTVSEMAEVVQALAHDSSNNTYAGALVAARMGDAYNDLVDQIMAHPMARRCLYKVGAATTSADEIELPSDCKRLLSMEWYVEDDEEWILLPKNDQGSFPPAAAFPRSATFAITRGTTATAGDPLTWRASPDGDSVLIYPLDAEGSVRFVYLAKPVWVAADNAAMTLPDGADELLEYLAAEKLIAAEPQDPKRIRTYAAYYAARFRTWAAGIGAGRIDHTQRVVVEAPE